MIDKFSMMKKKTLLTPQQEELLKKFNKNFDPKEKNSLSDNENTKFQDKFVKKQTYRGTNRGR